jgi:hypothetical protein
VAISALAVWLFPISSCLRARGAADPVTPQITVDQFGWLPRAGKVAILADPVKGQNAGQSYRPGREFEIRREGDGTVVYRGAIKPWNNGRVSELAGDRVWYADFSNLHRPGSYHVFDTTNRVRSFTFRVGEDVYVPVLRDAVRVFYYQRSGTPINEMNGGVWHHPGGHLGRDQHRAARYTQGGNALGRPRNVLGGWFDAGDLNKYVPYLEATLFDLLWAYELNPRAFGDNTNIPESGNGVPDLLDEVKWELDWILKMQDTDGGFFNRVAGRSYNNGTGSPHGDTQPRFYTAKTTWATADASASLAHAARVYTRFDKASPPTPTGSVKPRAGPGRISMRTPRWIPPTEPTAIRSLRPRLPIAMRTPIAAPASMPPPNCSRRSMSRDSRLMSIAGRPTSPRPRKTACTPSRTGSRWTRSTTWR